MTLSGSKRRRKVQKLIERDGAFCWWCGCDVVEEEATLDHIKARSRGGSDALSNLIISCGPCNNLKQATNPWVWIAALCSDQDTREWLKEHRERIGRARQAMGVRTASNRKRRHLKNSYVSGGVCKGTLIQRDGLLCWWCGRALTYERATMDHVMPQHLGGSHNKKNLVLSCGSCNRAKADHHPLVWLAALCSDEFPARWMKSHGARLRHLKKQAKLSTSAGRIPDHV